MIYFCGTVLFQIVAKLYASIPQCNVKKNCTEGLLLLIEIHFYWIFRAQCHFQNGCNWNGTGARKMRKLVENFVSTVRDYWSEIDCVCHFLFFAELFTFFEKSIVPFGIISWETIMISMSTIPQVTQQLILIKMADTIRDMEHLGQKIPSRREL